MKIVNGQKIFTLEMDEQKLSILSKYLANQEYVERSLLINDINVQISQQSKPRAIGEFATEMARESSPALVK